MSLAARVRVNAEAAAMAAYPRLENVRRLVQLHLVAPVVSGQHRDDVEVPPTTTTTTSRGLDGARPPAVIRRDDLAAPPGRATDRPPAFGRSGIGKATAVKPLCIDDASSAARPADRPCVDRLSSSSPTQVHARSPPRARCQPRSTTANVRCMPDVRHISTSG